MAHSICSSYEHMFSTITLAQKRDKTAIGWVRFSLAWLVWSDAIVLSKAKHQQIQGCSKYKSRPPKTPSAQKCYPCAIPPKRSLPHSGRFILRNIALYRLSFSIERKSGSPFIVYMPGSL